MLPSSVPIEEDEYNTGRDQQSLILRERQKRIDSLRRLKEEYEEKLNLINQELLDLEEGRDTQYNDNLFKDFWCAPNNFSASSYVKFQHRNNSSGENHPLLSNDLTEEEKVFICCHIRNIAENMERIKRIEDHNLDVPVFDSCAHVEKMLGIPSSTIRSYIQNLRKRKRLHTNSGRPHLVTPDVVHTIKKAGENKNFNVNDAKNVARNAISTFTIGDTVFQSPQKLKPLTFKRICKKAEVSFE